MSYNVVRRYEALSNQIKEEGLKKEEISLSRKLYTSIDGTPFLNDNAYKPTGVALGCPIPDQNFKNHLWEITKSLADRLTKIKSENVPSFAFVPSDWYHITIMNFTQYAANV